jgi:hypothetical protein
MLDHKGPPRNIEAMVNDSGLQLQRLGDSRSAGWLEIIGWKLKPNPPIDAVDYVR